MLNSFISTSRGDWICDGAIKVIISIDFQEVISGEIVTRLNV